MAKIDFKEEQLLKFYEKASLKKIVEYLIEEFGWHEIKLIPVKKVNIKKFLDLDSPIKIAEVEIPKVNRKAFMSFAKQIDENIKIRLDKFINDEPLIIPERIKEIELCILRCNEEIGIYDSSNLFKFIFGISWKLKIKAESYLPISYDLLILSDYQKIIINEEFILRKQFFEWMKMRFANTAEIIKYKPNISPYIEWFEDTQRPNLKIAEYLVVMEATNQFTFKSDADKECFLQWIESIFNLGKTDWVVVYREIDRRKTANAIHLEKISEKYSAIRKSKYEKNSK